MASKFNRSRWNFRHSYAHASGNGNKLTRLDIVTGSETWNVWMTTPIFSITNFPITKECFNGTCITKNKHDRRTQNNNLKKVKHDWGEEYRIWRYSQNVVRYIFNVENDKRTSQKYWIFRREFAHADEVTLPAKVELM